MLKVKNAEALAEISGQPKIVNMYVVSVLYMKMKNLDILKKYACFEHDLGL